MIALVALLATLAKSGNVTQYAMTNYIRQPRISDSFNCNSFQISLWFRDIDDDAQCQDHQMFQINQLGSLQQTDNILFSVQLDKSAQIVNIMFMKSIQVLDYNSQGNWFQISIKNYNQNLTITLSSNVSQQSITQIISEYENDQCELIFYQQSVEYSSIQIFHDHLSFEQQFACQPGCVQCIQTELFQCLICYNLRILQTLNGQCECPENVQDISQTQCSQQFQQFGSLSHQTQECTLANCSVIPQYQIFQVDNKFIYKQQTFQTCEECIRNLKQNSNYYLFNVIEISLYYTSFPNCSFANNFINVIFRFILINNIELNQSGKFITKNNQITQLVAHLQKRECIQTELEQKTQLVNTNQEVVQLMSSKIWVGNIQNFKLLLIGTQIDIESKVISQLVQIQNYSIQEISINRQEYQIQFQTQILDLIIEGLILDNVHINNSHLISLSQNIYFNITISNFIIRNCVFTRSSLFSEIPIRAHYYNFTIVNSSFYNTILFQQSILKIEFMNIINCTFKNTLIFHNFNALSMIDFMFQASTLSQSYIVDTVYAEYIILNNVKLYQLIVPNEDIPLFNIDNCDDVNVLEFSIIYSQGEFELFNLWQSRKCQIMRMSVLHSYFQTTYALIQITSDFLTIEQTKFQNVTLQSNILLLIGSLNPKVYVSLDHLNFDNITVRGQKEATLISIKLEKDIETVVAINYLSLSSIFQYSLKKNAMCLFIGSSQLLMNNSELEIKDVTTFQGFLFVEAQHVEIQNQIYNIRIEQTLQAMFMGIISNYTIITGSKFINVGTLLFEGTLISQSSLVFEKNIIVNSIMNIYENQYKFILDNQKFVYFQENQIYQVEVLVSLILIESLETFFMSNNRINSISQRLISAQCKSLYMNNNIIIGIKTNDEDSCDVCILIQFRQGQKLAITGLIIQNMICNILEMISQEEIYLRNITLVHIQYRRALIYVVSENLLKMTISDVNIFAIKSPNCSTIYQRGNNVLIYLSSEQEELELTLYKLQIIKCEGTLIQLKVSPYALIEIILIIVIKNQCESFCFQMNLHQYSKQSRLLLLELRDDYLFMENNVYSIVPLDINSKNIEHYNYQSQLIKMYFQQQIILSFDKGITSFHNELTNQQELEFEVLIGNKLSRHIYISSGIPLTNYLIFDRQRNIYKEISLYMQFSINNQLVQNSSCKLMFNQSSGQKQFPFIMEEQNWEFLQIISKPNDIVQFRISCDITSNEQSNYKSTSLVFFTKILQCQLGQIQVQLRCHICSIEQQEYTVEKNSVFCKNKDPQTMKSVKYGLIELHQGFWRPKIGNDVIELCIESQNSCNGGFKVGNELCEAGYLGAICSDCDSGNIQGKGSFIKNSLNKCQICNFQWSDIIKFCFYAFLSAYFIFSNTKQFYDILRQRKIDLLVKKKTHRFAQASERTGIYIQFLLQYFQIITNTNNYSIVSLIPFQFRPNIFDNASFSYMNYVDCFISPYFNSQIWLYLRLFFLLICYFLILYLYFLLYFIMLRISHVRYSFFMIFIPIVNLYQNNIISYLSQIFLLLIPIDYSNMTWIQARMSQQYFTYNHLQSLAYFIIPQFSLIVWLPILQLISIKKMYNQIATKIKWVSTFQYLLYSYKENSFLSIYFIKLYSILIIIIVYSLQRQNNVRIIILMATAQLFYLVFQHYQPYQLYRFNSLRIKIQLMFFSQLILMGLSENDSLFVFNYILQLIYYLIFGIVVLIIAKDLIPELDLDNMHWTDKLRGMLKMELRSAKINSIRNQFKQAHRSISLQLTLKKRRLDVEANELN